MLIAGNWKMNGLREQASRLVRDLVGSGPDGVSLLLCPPATLLGDVRRMLGASPIGVGGQDCHTAQSGAHTGDVSAAMLADLGATHVIVGHSERRRDHGEASPLVRAKADAARAAGLTPILCVGESLDDRRAGREEAVIGAQLGESVPDGFTGVVAYEPVWAIGTGEAASLDDIATMHRFVRYALTARLGAAGRAVPILYGGSVKPDNAGAILAQNDVGGALVGGASLEAASFLGIARAAREINLPVH